MNRRRPLDLLGAWLLVVLGGVLLLTGAATFVGALVRGDWAALLVTAVLLLVVGFGIARGLGQLRRGRSSGTGTNEP